MKKKQFRHKYYSKQKSLTLAITALMLSGTPLATVSVFASEETEPKSSQLEDGTPRNTNYYVNLVESLFDSPTSNKIANGVDYLKVKAVQDALMNLSYATYPDVGKWRNRTSVAIDGVVRAAAQTSRNLFQDSSWTTLNPSVTQTVITTAFKLNEQLPNKINGSLTELSTFEGKNLVEKAQKLFNLPLREKIEGLFTDSTYTKLVADVDRVTVQSFRAIASATTYAEDKAEFLALLTKASALIKDSTYYSEYLESFIFFTQSWHLADGVDYSDYLNVRSVIFTSSMFHFPEHAHWVAVMNMMEALIGQKGVNQVNLLFENNENNNLKSSTTQAQITYATNYVNPIPDYISHTIGLAVKPAKILATKAQSLYNERVSTLVKGLFTNNAQTTLTEGVNQRTINELSLIVAELPDSETKNDLLNQIEVAQQLLTGKPQLEEAQRAVSGLFTDKGHTALATDVTQERINVAQNLVNQLSESQSKVELGNLIKIAQDLLDKQIMKVEITEFETYSEGVSIFISGKFTGKDVKYMRPIVNGENKLLITSTALANGAFSYYLPGLKATDQVEFVLFDANYKEVARKAVTITASSTQITKFEIYEVGKSNFIRGEFSGANVKYMRPVVNGENKGLVTSTTLATGTFSYYMPGLKVTDKVEFVLFDANYKEVARKVVPITAAPAAIVISTFSAYVEGNSVFIKGSYSGTNAKYMRPVVNDENKALISSSTLSDGTFSYYLPGLKATDKVEFVLFDANYKEITRKLLVVTTAVTMA